MSTKWKIVIAILILVVTLFLNFVLSMAVGVSIISEVTVAINEEEPADSPAIEEENSETVIDDTTYVVGENCYDELHKLILMTDIDKIPDDANYIDTKTTAVLTMDGSNPIPIKAYLRVYALAAEICMREEINPKDAEVKIEPMDLIGEAFCESGLNRFAKDLSRTTSLWLPKSEILKAGVDQRALELQPGADWGSPWANQGDIAEIYGLASCPSFIGQALFYSYCWTTQSDFRACIYISQEENPDLPMEQRAIWGRRKDIYEGNGQYLTGDFWRNEKAMPKVSYEELKTNIKQGIFEKGKEFGYQTRPASYFLPDCFYTHALAIRSALLDRAKDSPDLHRFDSTGRWSTANFDKHLGTLDTEQKEYLKTVKKMYAFTRFMGDSQLDHGQTFVYDSSSDPPGDLVKVYCELVEKKINPLVDPFDNLTLWTNLLGRTNSICHVYIHGDSSIDPEQKYKLSLENTVLATDGEVKGLTGENAPLNHTLYGYDCVNAGNLCKPAFEAQIRGAYRTYPKPIQQSQPKPTEKTQSSSNLCWPLSGNYTTIAAEGYYGKRKGYFHPGIDITVIAGEPVYSIASGTVLEVVQTDSDDFGIINYIIIEHDTYKNYKFCSMYSNIKTDLSVGDKVTQHQTLGTIRSYTAETYVEVISQEQGIPEVDAARKSFLHFTVYLYNPDSEIATISDISGAWIMDRDYLFSYRFNPMCLDWYNGTSDTASKVSPKAHTGEDLITSYENCSGYDDSCNIWEVTFNSKDPGNPECSIDNLEEEVNAWHTNESYNIYGYDFNISSSYNVTIDDTSLSYEEVVSNIVQSSYSKSESESKFNAEGVTGLFGVKCVPPLDEVYFKSITQFYGDGWESSEEAGIGHAGMDFGTNREKGKPVYAVADGVITRTLSGYKENDEGGSYDDGFGYGNQIIQEIATKPINGRIYYIKVMYCHLAFKGGVQVSENDKVKAGQLIGYTGHTGWSTDPHFHLELRIPEDLLNLMNLDFNSSDNREYPCRWYWQPGRKAITPWLLYCLDPKYDFLVGKRNGLGEYVPAFVTFVIDGVKMDPTDPEFRRVYRS